ncbi:MAG: SDR family NAD(P)-dependent oxidoreductase [Pseudomonadota bacterium]
MAKHPKSVVITGATSGIGFAIAEHLAREGWLVFPGYRSDDDAKDLQGLGPQVHPVKMDVTQRETLEAARQDVQSHLGARRLTGLVNNAGIAKLAPLMLQDVDEFASHLDINAVGALRASQVFGDLLGMETTLTGPPGRIVTITSMGGELASPFLGAYTASKHAAESISDSLRRELIVYGIDAIVVGPGSVKTPIWQKAKDADAAEKFSDTRWGKPIRAFLDGMVKGGENGLEPQEVARVVETALTARNPKARYAPVPNKLRSFILPKLLPKRLVDRGFWSQYDFPRI